MTDSRIHKLAQILVDHSIKVGLGNRVAITATTVAEPLARTSFELVLDRGGNPHILFDLRGQDEILFAHANVAEIRVDNELVYRDGQFVF